MLDDHGKLTRRSRTVALPLCLSPDHSHSRTVVARSPSGSERREPEGRACSCALCGAAGSELRRWRHRGWSCGRALCRCCAVCRAAGCPDGRRWLMRRCGSAQAGKQQPRRATTPRTQPVKRMASYTSCDQQHRMLKKKALVRHAPFTCHLILKLIEMRGRRR
jgi:hypothetical protein